MKIKETKLPDEDTTKYLLTKDETLYIKYVLMTIASYIAIFGLFTLVFGAESYVFAQFMFIPLIVLVSELLTPVLRTYTLSNAFKMYCFLIPTTLLWSAVIYALVDIEDIKGMAIFGSLVLIIVFIVKIVSIFKQDSDNFANSRFNHSKSVKSKYEKRQDKKEMRKIAQGYHIDVFENYDYRNLYVAALIYFIGLIVNIALIILMVYFLIK